MKIKNENAKRFNKAIDPKLFIGHSIAPPLIGACLLHLQ